MPLKDPEKRREYVREWRRKKREAGLCIECGANKQKEGCSRCELCLLRMKKRSRAIIESGICKRCEKKPATNGQLCSVCAKKTKRDWLSWAESKRRNGLCSRCGGGKDDPDKDECVNCISNRVDGNKERRIRKRILG